MRPPRQPDVGEIARLVLDDDGAPVKARTLAARVVYRQELFGREATTSEAEPLRQVYGQRRRVVVELARRYCR